MLEQILSAVKLRLRRALPLACARGPQPNPLKWRSNARCPHAPALLHQELGTGCSPLLRLTQAGLGGACLHRLA